MPLRAQLLADVLPESIRKLETSAFQRFFGWRL